METKEKGAENDFKKASFNMMKETLHIFLNYKSESVLIDTKEEVQIKYNHYGMSSLGEVKFIIIWLFVCTS
jgi:hypothetical protein